MRRREFLVLLSTIGASGRSYAQSEKVWRIGQVLAGERKSVEQLAAALELELGKVGYLSGKTARLTNRFAELEPEALQRAIAALVPEVDLLATWGTVAAVAAKKAAPPSLPVVFMTVGDPVAIGLVATLSRPGANMTGITFEAAMETYGRRLQLLKEVVPSLSLVAVLRATGDANVRPAMSALDDAALRLGVRLLPLDFATPGDLDHAFATMEAEKVEGVVVVAGSATFVNRRRIADLAVAHGLPSSHGFKETVLAGGLLSVGPDLIAMARQGAVLIDKIIKGAKPADLPVEQPTRFEVAINARTARELHIVIPPSVLARADEVIE